MHGDRKEEERASLCILRRDFKFAVAHKSDLKGDQREIIQSERNGMILVNKGYLYTTCTQEIITELNCIGFVEENQIARNGLLGTATPDANVVQVLKSLYHDHPPSLEEVEALRRCISRKRAAENEPVAGPAQIIQRKLEGVPSGVLPCRGAENEMARSREQRGEEIRVVKTRERCVRSRGRSGEVQRTEWFGADNGVARKREHNVEGQRTE
ncbi:hypothetical protein ANN_23478 [Periplaneta americana]|uniref:Uncharacterized protein n=1 Tax=Periplaneta americana TaxID=6978 RepID=A0ABQ8SL93_PERAM|nr:hypothetical protein ANN_23478 [Periplaneta americana]